MQTKTPTIKLNFGSPGVKFQRYILIINIFYIVRYCHQYSSLFYVGRGITNANPRLSERRETNQKKKMIDFIMQISQ